MKTAYKRLNRDHRIEIEKLNHEKTNPTYKNTTIISTFEFPK